MELGLKEREVDDPAQQELDKAHKRIGELSMENELLRKDRQDRPFCFEEVSTWIVRFYPFTCVQIRV
jgi:hypothetical protein